MAVPFVEAEILSSSRDVPAGTIIILPENVLNFKRGIARIDRIVKQAQANLATIRKSFDIESDVDDASSSENHCEENPFARYIKKGLIIPWDCTQLPIASFLQKFGDEAKVNWSASEISEFLANKEHEKLPKHEEVVTKSKTILRYAIPRHAGAMHDYFLPLQSLISNVESALELAEGSISMCQMVSLAAHHKDSNGKHTFQLAVVEWQNPEEESKMCLFVFIRANPTLVQHMGVSSAGAVLPDMQKLMQIEEDLQMREQHAAELKTQEQQGNQRRQNESWTSSTSSWQQRPSYKKPRNTWTSNQWPA
jgi:hypothetical protein